MILPGLCSVTFRKLSADEIIALATENGLAAIEWGGDIHVPVGDLATAAAVRRRSVEAGLCTPSYGSYFRMTSDATPAAFAPTIETAGSLDAKTIRVWAGSKASCEMDEDDWQRLLDAGRALAEMTARAGCCIGFEYHLGTATDTNASARRLIDGIAHPAALLYWQPRQKMTVAQRLESLRQAQPALAHLHVFHWAGERDERLPLSDGHEDWRQYLACAAERPGERYAYLEFVAGDSIQVLARDAATLRAMLFEL